MSKAHVARLAIGLLGGALATWAFLQLQPLWLGIAVFAAAMVVSSAAASKVFARLATPEEIRADLEDRVRNPPA